MPKSSANLVKIGQASKILKVSIDTLRRWEKAGKITAIRTPGGTRLYSLDQLGKTPQTISPISTEELLKKTEDVLSSKHYVSSIAPDTTATPTKASNLFTKLLLLGAVLSVISLISFISWITSSYFIRSDNTEPIPLTLDPKPSSAVLAVTSASRFLEINSDTQINGSLFVRDQINNLSLEGTPSASTINLTSGSTSLTVTNSATLDQDVSTTSTPTFNSLNLSATSNQLVFQSGGPASPSLGGPTGTLTWTPTAARIITLPDATTTLVGRDTTDTLTNKSISGSTNTLTNIPNSALTNPSLTVTAGTNLEGGGTVALGGTITISAKSSPSFSGQVLIANGTAAAPGLAFTDDTDSGLYRIGANNISLITAGTAGNGITIDSSGNVGIATITPTSKLHVVGTATITGTTILSSSLDVSGNVGLSSSLTVSSASILNSLQVTKSISGATLGISGASNLSGNVGIGSSLTVTSGTVLSSSLDVSGNTNLTTLNASGTTNLSTAYINSLGIGSLYNGVTLPSNGLAVQGNVGVGTSSPSNKLSVLGTADIFGGNLGIGTSTPGARLAVAGGGLFGYTGTQALSSGASLGVLGNVGIGTTSPNYTLEVVGTTNITGNTTIGGSLTVLGAQTFSGALSLSDGSAATPALNFTNDTDSGLWRIGANQIALTTGGLSHNGLSINSSGNVGIGTTSAGAKLQVNTTVGGADAIRLIDGTSGGTARFYFTSAVGTPPDLNINAGRVIFPEWTRFIGPMELGTLGSYISASSSNNQFFGHYGAQFNFGDSTFTGGTVTIKPRGDTTAAFDLTVLKLQSLYGTNGNPTAVIMAASAQTANLLAFRNSSGAFLSGFDATGNLGIGTSTPGSQIQITGGQVIGFGAAPFAAPSQGLVVSGNVGIGTSTPGTAKLAVLGGNVGIGTTSPNYTLEVVGTTNITGNTTIGGNLTVAGSQTFSGQMLLADGSNSSPSLAFTNDTDTGLFRFGTNGLALTTAGSGVNLLSLDSAGNVGIGTTNATAKLQVADGGINITNNQDGTAPQLNLRYNGTTAVSEVINYYSGANLKHSVGNYTGNNDFFIDSYTNVGDKKTPFTANADNLEILLDPNGESWKIGIGTNAPDAKLGISGNVAIGSSYATVVAPTDGLAVQGNVGIGTSSPNYKLEVVGTTNITGNTTIGGNLTVAGTQSFSGALSLSDGSAATPALNFTNDTDSGLWRIGANQIALTTGGGTNNGLSINSSGNVGIGTTNAGAPLAIRVPTATAGGAGTNATAINFLHGNGTSAGNITVGGNTMRFTSGGAYYFDAGIRPTNSITAQSGTLTMQGNGGGTGASVQLLGQAAALSPYILKITPGSSGSFTAEIPNVVLDSGTITITGAYTNQRFVQFGQQTVTAASALTITNADTINIAGAPISAGSALITNAVGLRISSGTSVASGVTNAYGLFVDAPTGATNNYAAVFNTGNVGIGSSFPGSSLQVAGNAVFGYGSATFAAPSQGLVVSGNVGIGTSTPGTAKLAVLGGNVGIGTTSPNYTLEVVGTTNITGNTTIGGNLTVAGSQTFSGQLQLADGSNSAPSLAFTNDTDTGLFRFGTNGLALTTGGSGTSLISLNSGGNVGIGTTNPGTKLDVRGDITILSGSDIRPTSDSTTALNIANAAGTNFVTFDTTNSRVGISTTPSYKFHVAGAAGTNWPTAVITAVGDTSTAMAAQFQARPGSTADAGIVIGATGIAFPGHTSGTIGDAIGLLGTVQWDRGGNITKGAGVMGQVRNYSSDGTGTLTTGYALVGSAVTNTGTTLFNTPSDGTGGGTDVTNMIGLYIGDVASRTDPTPPSGNFGIFSAGGTSFFAGNIGIGVSNPGTKLAVAGGGLFGYTGTQNLSSGASLGVLGNVGIGTTSPNFNLEVVGTTNITGNTTIGGNLTVAGTQSFSGQLQLADGTNSSPSLAFTNDTDTGLWRSTTNIVALTTNGAGALQTGSTINGMVVNASGFVGIGTTTPSLAVGTAGLSVISSSAELNLTSNATGGRNISLISTTGPSGLLLRDNTAGSYIHQLADSGGNMGIGTGLQTLSSRLAVAGNVGIGISFATAVTPVDGLAVQGNVGIGATTANSALFVNGGASIGSSFNVTAPSNGLIVQGNVGIGFTSPGTKLDVYDTTSTSNIDIFRVLSNVSGTGTVKFRVDSDGDVFSDGGTSMGTPADVAENYPVFDESIQAGDLVTTSDQVSPITNKYGELQPYIQKSDSSYQNNLIGIISTKPGVLLSANTEGRAVALSGRVPIKIATSSASIQPGDYLTSSDEKGKAMKASKPGQVVGKALETWTPNAGKDTILVFVNVSFADPGNFLASLSLDDDGNLIAPKIKTEKLLISDDIEFIPTDTLITYESSDTADNSGTDYAIDVIASLKNLDNAVLDVKSKQATDSANITDLAAQLASAAAELAETKSKVDSLDLTPPQLLFATGSATLANLSASEATVSGMLTAYQAEISDHFKVYGQTTLSKTAINGDLFVDGTLSIENGSEINVMGTLFLQKGLLAEDVNIFDGKVVIDNEGNIKTAGKITASEIKTNKLTVSSTDATGSATLAATIGTDTLKANTTKITVSSNEATDSAKVFITPTTVTDKVLSVSNIKNGLSFDVVTLIAPTSDINFNWWIIATR